MLPSFLRRQSLGHHILMVAVSLGVLGALLFLVAFWESGLQWWIRGWEQGASSLAVFALAVVVVFLTGALIYGLALSGLMDEHLLLYCALLMSGVVGYMAVLTLSDSRIDNVGPVSLYRASDVRAALEKMDASVAALPDNTKIPEVVIDDMVELRMSLAVGSHHALRAAHDRLVGALDGKKLERAFNAAALLGVSDTDAVRAARIRGWMRPQELQALRDAARAKAAKKDGARQFTALQELAYLALVEEDGLSSDLDYEPRVEVAQETKP